MTLKEFIFENRHKINSFSKNFDKDRFLGFLRFARAFLNIDDFEKLFFLICDKLNQNIKVELVERARPSLNLSNVPLDIYFSYDDLERTRRFYAEVPLNIYTNIPKFCVYLKEMIERAYHLKLLNIENLFKWD